MASGIFLFKRKKEENKCLITRLVIPPIRTLVSNKHRVISRSAAWLYPVQSSCTPKKQAHLLNGAGAQIILAVERLAVSFVDIVDVVRKVFPRGCNGSVGNELPWSDIAVIVALLDNLHSQAWSLSQQPHTPELNLAGLNPQLLQAFAPTSKGLHT